MAVMIRCPQAFTHIINNSLITLNLTDRNVEYFPYQCFKELFAHMLCCRV